ncbi:hypothetical protein LTR17_015999 [Elasticomyces elasticus]|nr:hypothetical protein LTR17_015999 [Elasticomyces elasticus]
MAGKRKAAEADVNSEEGRMTRSSYKFCETIDVLVGPEKKRFGVPKKVLRDRSGFFDRAMRFNETNGNGDKPIELADEEPVNFDLYLFVVYKGSFACTTPDLDRDDWLLRGLVNTYVLADKIQDPDAADVLIDMILEHITEDDAVTALETVFEAWDMAPDKSTLRLLLLDDLVIGRKPEWLRYWLASEKYIPGDLACAIGQKYAALAVDMKLDFGEYQLRAKVAGTYHNGSDLHLDFTASVKRP